MPEESAIIVPKSDTMQAIVEGSELQFNPKLAKILGDQNLWKADLLILDDVEEIILPVTKNRVIVPTVFVALTEWLRIQNQLNLREISLNLQTKINDADPSGSDISELQKSAEHLQEFIERRQKDGDIKKLTEIESVKIEGALTALRKIMVDKLGAKDNSLSDLDTYLRETLCDESCSIIIEGSSKHDGDGAFGKVGAIAKNSVQNSFFEPAISAIALGTYAGATSTLNPLTILYGAIAGAGGGYAISILLDKSDRLSNEQKAFIYAWIPGIIATLTGIQLGGGATTVAGITGGIAGAGSVIAAEPYLRAIYEKRNKDRNLLGGETSAHVLDKLLGDSNIRKTTISRLKQLELVIVSIEDYYLKNATGVELKNNLVDLENFFVGGVDETMEEIEITLSEIKMLKSLSSKFQTANVRQKESYLRQILTKIISFDKNSEKITGIIDKLTIIRDSENLPNDKLKKTNLFLIKFFKKIKRSVDAIMNMKQSLEDLEWGVSNVSNVSNVSTVTYDKRWDSFIFTHFSIESNDLNDIDTIPQKLSDLFSAPKIINKFKEFIAAREFAKAGELLGLDGPFLQDLNSEDSKKDIIIDGQKNVLIRKIEKLTLSEEFKIALIRILEGESYNPMLEDEIKAQKAEKLKKQEESRKNLMQGIKAIDWNFFVSYAPAFLAANFINQNNLFFIPQFLHSFLKSIPTYISLPEEPVTTVLVLLTLAYLVDNLPFVSLIRKGIHKALPAKKDK